MSKKDVENHRDKFSKAYNPKDANNIWNKNFDAMALKTVVIQALKLCPISIEAMDAVIKDERADLKDVSDDIEFSVTDIPAESVNETPAIEEPKTEQKEQPKTVPIQPSFENMEMTPEEESLADQAFEAAQTTNVGDIF